MATSIGHSCEPKRTSAYSEDIRWRMVWLRELQGYTLDKVAANLCVDVSTVHRIVSKFRVSGSVSKKLRSACEHPNTRLTKPVQLTILHLVLGNPGAYLWEIQQQILWMYGLDISPASICIFLKKSNFSRKKMQLVALQQDKELRAVFATDVSIYPSHLLIFIDETGCDRRDALRKYGYGLRGHPVKCQKLLVRGERVSVIAAMTIRGVLDLQVVRESVTGDIFVEFIEKRLLPNLMTFNGVDPNSVVILDNCSVHHVSGVESCIEDVGALVHYLPPYSPDYNPIEMLFGKVKSAIRAMELELSATDDIETIVLAAFATVTAEDCENWINACCIYN